MSYNSVDYPDEFTPHDLPRRTSTLPKRVTDYSTVSDIGALSLRQKLLRIATNRLFVLLTLTLSSLYFVITGVQYWISSYLYIVLGIDES